MDLEFFNQMKSVHALTNLALARGVVHNKALEFIIDRQIENIETELNKKFSFISGYTFKVIKEKAVK